MTASTSVVSVCNRSLLSLGARAQISNLNEGSTEANACSVLYNPCFESLARSAFWNCLRQQAVLSLLTAAAGTPENPQGTTLPLPPTPWLYSYQLPSDCLQARNIIPNFPAQGTGSIGGAFVASQSWLSGNGQIPFQVAYATDVSGNPIQTVLTNQTQAVLVYTVNQSNPVIWDSLFEEAMVQSLAAYLVPALAMNLPLMGAAMKRAEGMIAQARVRDGNENTTCQDHYPEWITARNGGASWGACSNGGYYGPQGMVWPG